MAHDAAPTAGVETLCRGAREQDLARPRQVLAQLRSQVHLEPEDVGFQIDHLAPADPVAEAYALGRAPRTIEAAQRGLDGFDAVASCRHAVVAQQQAVA